MSEEVVLKIKGKALNKLQVLKDEYGYKSNAKLVRSALELLYSLVPIKSKRNDIIVKKGNKLYLVKVLRKR